MVRRAISWSQVSEHWLSNDSNVDEESSEKVNFKIHGVHSRQVSASVQIVRMIDMSKKMLMPTKEKSSHVGVTS